MILTSSPTITIRTIEQSDLEDFYLYRSNPNVTKYQWFDVMTKQECKEFIDNQSWKVFGNPWERVQYAIVDNTSGKLVGDCAIHLQQDPRIAEIGITVSHLHQRKWYAKQAMILLMKFLFEDKLIHRIVETVDAENIACIRLLEYLHFRKEWHFVDNIFFKWAWGSEYQYAMLDRERRFYHTN